MATPKAPSTHRPWQLLGCLDLHSLLSAEANHCRPARQHHACAALHFAHDPWVSHVGVVALGGIGLQHRVDHLMAFKVQPECPHREGGLVGEHDDTGGLAVQRLEAHLQEGRMTGRDHGKNNTIATWLCSLGCRNVQSRKARAGSCNNLSHLQIPASHECGQTASIIESCSATPARAAAMTLCILCSCKPARSADNRREADECYQVV
jgi:hypothetical protein